MMGKNGPKRAVKTNTCKQGCRQPVSGRRGRVRARGGTKIGNDENDLPLTSTANGELTQINGAINWGADGFGQLTGVRVGSGEAASVVPIGQTVWFGADGSVIPAGPGGAQPDGAAASLLVEASGSYTLTVLATMNHAAGGTVVQGEDWLNLETVRLMGEDGDGDPISVALETRVQDDVPVHVKVLGVPVPLVALLEGVCIEWRWRRDWQQRVV